MTSLIVTSSESTHAESKGKGLTFDHAKNHYTMSTRYEKVELVLEFIDGPSCEKSGIRIFSVNTACTFTHK